MDYLLRFQYLHNPGKGFAFPCNKDGNVNLDTLTEKQKENYLFARATVGREVALPEVKPCYN
jgi:hypothetical protein